MRTVFNGMVLFGSLSLLLLVLSSMEFLAAVLKAAIITWEEEGRERLRTRLLRRKKRISKSHK